MFSLNNNAVLNDADVIKLSAQGKAFSDVNVTVAAELMKNQQQTSPLDPTGNIEVGQDNKGWPMIFTIGTDKKFYLMKLDSSVAGGYSMINLSDSLGAGMEAIAFAMTQDNKGKISITLAMAKKGGGDTILYAASRLSNNYAETDWANFSSLARKVEGANPAFKVEQMLMSITDDGKAPVSVIAGNLKGYKYYYLLDGTGTAVKYEFPEDVKKHPDSLKDIAIGYAFGQTGIFFIYDIGETQTLACTTLADPGLGSLSYDYSPGNDDIPEPFRYLTYNCIATPTGSKNKPISICSDIFVGAPTGVYCFKNASVNKCQLVTDKIKDVHQLTITQDKDSIVVWASVAGNKLYYVYGKKEANGERYIWNDPVLFKEGVLQIAPMRNSVRKGNELYLVGQDKSIHHYWQDAGSTLWSQQTINVADQNDIIEFNSYTTHLHFEDSKGKALIEEKVKITASEWVYVTINGFIYSLDKGSSAEVSTDIMGNVTIITLTDDIACPIYHLTADWLDKTLNIYPNAKVTRGLADIRTGADLKNAKTEDGKPVLTNSSYNNQTLDGVAGQISQLADKSGQIKGNLKSGARPYTFTAVENKGVLHTGNLSINSIPDKFMFSYGKAGSLALVAAPGDIFNDIKNFAGDALHYLETFVNTTIKAIEKGLVVLENGIKFVLKKIDEGLQFVLEIGDKILNIVLDTLGAVFKALNWVLKLVGIDLEKVLEWLGKLIGWTDILETSDKICDMINNGFDIIAGTGDVLRDKVTGIFRDIEVAIGGEDLVNKLGEVGKTNQTDGRSGALQNPAGNFVNYHLIHGQSSPMLSAGNDNFAEELERVFKDLIKKEIFTAGKALDMIGDLLSHISTDTIGQTITRLFQIIAVTALEEVKHGIVALLSLLELMVKTIKAALNTKMDIPILSGVLKLLLGGRELTILRVVSIMVALPLRIIYRIATGDAFPHEKMTVIDVGEAHDILKEKLNTSPKLLAGNAQATDLTAPQEQVTYQGALWVMVVYEIARFCEVTVGAFDLYNNLTSNAVVAAGSWQDNVRNRRGQLSIIKTALGTLCTVLNMANLIELHKAKKSGGSFNITDVTTYEWTQVALSLAKSGMGALSALSEGVKPYTRGISALISLVLNILLIEQFTREEKIRPNNLRFTSNLFLNLYKMVLDCPFKVSHPKAAAAICIGDALMGYTHVGIVGARWSTDNDDKVSFKII